MFFVATQAPKNFKTYILQQKLHQINVLKKFGILPEACDSGRSMIEPIQTLIPVWVNPLWKKFGKLKHKHPWFIYFASNGVVFDCPEKIGKFPG